MIRMAAGMLPHGNGSGRSDWLTRNRSREASQPRLVAAALGIASAGFVDLAYTQTIGLFAPGIAIVALLVIGNRVFRGLSIDWLVLTGLLIFWLILAACFGVYGGMRSLGFAVYMGLPLLGLAMLPGAAIVPFTISYAGVATVSMVLWMTVLLVGGYGELKPWGLWSPSASINTYGVLLNMLWPLLLMRGLHNPSGSMRWSLLWLALSGILAAMATFSRLAIVTAILLGSIILIRRWPLYGGLGLFGVAGLAWAFGDELHTLLVNFRLVGWTPQFSRPAIWGLALDVSEGHYWFGQAPGGAKYVLAPLNMYTAHNDVVNLLLEAGAVAAVLGFTLLFCLLCIAFRAVLRGGPGLFAGCSILAYVLSTLVSASMTRPELTLALALGLGVCRWQRPLDNRSRSGQEQPC